MSQGQRRDVLQGLLYTQAVQEELVARGKEPMDEGQALAIFDLHVAFERRTNPSGNYGPTVVQNCPAAASNQAGGSTGYIRNATSGQTNAQEAA